MTRAAPQSHLGRRALLAAPLALAAGCAGRGAATDSDAASSADPMVLRLAHNLSGSHPTSVAISAFADSVEELTEGRIRIDIYASGQLGSEPAVLGQLVQGIVDITRVGSPGLASYHAGYHTFGLPYVFRSEEQMHQVLDSPQMAEFYRSTQERGFVGLTHYTSGARSFYTRGTAIRTPEDIRGKKIRVQDMRSQTQLMEELHGAPVVMGFGDTYTALQTRLIDGAESNETVLTDSAHGEVAKVFSRTRHTIIPDLMLISSEAWQKLSAADQELVMQAARQSSLDHREAWDDAILAAEEQALTMGVEFVDDIDLESFRSATAPVVERFAQEFPEVADLLTVIETVNEETS